MIAAARWRVLGPASSALGLPGFATEQGAGVAKQVNPEIRYISGRKPLWVRVPPPARLHPAVLASVPMRWYLVSCIGSRFPTQLGAEDCPRRWFFRGGTHCSGPRDSPHPSRESNSGTDGRTEPAIPASRARHSARNADSQSVGFL